MNKLPLSEDYCILWFQFLETSFALHLMVQVILGLQDNRIGIMFITLFMVEVALGPTYMHPVYTTTPFNATCDVTEILSLLVTHCFKGNEQLAIFDSSFIVLLQSAVLASMVAKARLVRRHVLVVGIVLRDDVAIFVIMCGDSPVFSPHNTYIMITNMNSLTVLQGSPTSDDSDIVLTTVIESGIE
ncbi:hypothetical protein BDQ17DRAFT_1334693 [Cyathus striatus]|nr:hypothetical protein BDQ17DRAFT_1334693 [Cyathus striatus]